MTRAAAGQERWHDSKRGSAARSRKRKLVGVDSGSANLGNDAGGFRNQVCTLLGLSQRQCFRCEDHGIVMVAAAAVTFCKTQSGVDGSGCPLDDLLEQLLAPIRVSA